MNGETRKFVRLLALLGGVGGLLCGCVDSPFTPPPSDKTSPIAAEADAAAAASVRRPTFADIPEMPTDVPKPAEYRKAVAGQQAAGRQLTRDTAADTFTLTGTEAFAARARREAQVPPSEMPTDADRAATEAFAKAARSRATPPPSKPQ